MVEQDRVSVIAPESVIAVTVSNLVSNAIRYTQEGEVVVLVGKGRLAVEDTGPGIPEEELARVMDRHYRGEKATGKGSGLGLAIVKRLCDLYGWTSVSRIVPKAACARSWCFLAPAPGAAPAAERWERWGTLGSESRVRVGPL